MMFSWLFSGQRVIDNWLMVVMGKTLCFGLWGPALDKEHYLRYIPLRV